MDEDHSGTVSSCLSHSSRDLRRIHRATEGMSLPGSRIYAVPGDVPSPAVGAHRQERHGEEIRMSRYIRLRRVIRPSFLNPGGAVIPPRSPPVPVANVGNSMDGLVLTRMPLSWASMSDVPARRDR